MRSSKENQKRIHSIIKEWRKLAPEEHYSKTPFGTYNLVEVDGELMIDHTSKILRIFDFMLDENGELLLKFWRCNALEIFIYDANKLKSFKNFPRIISQQKELKRYDMSFTSAFVCNIDNWEGFPQIVGGKGGFGLFHFPNLTFHNIDKYCERIDKIQFNNTYCGPILSIMKMKYQDARVIDCHSANNSLNLAISIMKKHMMGEKDLLDCQEEMISAGLKQYAKL